MAILKNVELFYPRLDPKKPNSKFNKEQPTWEVQIRTRDKAVKNEWAALNLKPKTVEDDDGKVFYSVTLRKKSKKKDGEVNQPVKVIDGGLNDINPMSIGNGSIGNIRIFQYEYGDEGKIAEGQALYQDALSLIEDGGFSYENQQRLYRSILSFNSITDLLKKTQGQSDAARPTAQAAQGE